MVKEKLKLKFKTLREHLKDPRDELDKLIVGFNLDEIKKEVNLIKKEKWKERCLKKLNSEEVETCATKHVIPPNFI